MSKEKIRIPIVTDLINRVIKKTHKRSMMDNANFASGNFDIDRFKSLGEEMKKGASESTNRVLDEVMKRVEIADQARK